MSCKVGTASKFEGLLFFYVFSLWKMGNDYFLFPVLFKTGGGEGHLILEGNFPFWFPFFLQ